MLGRAICALFTDKKQKQNEFKIELIRSIKQKEERELKRFKTKEAREKAKQFYLRPKAEAGVRDSIVRLESEGTFKYLNDCRGRLFPLEKGSTSLYEFGLGVIETSEIIELKWVFASVAADDKGRRKGWRGPGEMTYIKNINIWHLNYR